MLQLRRYRFTFIMAIVLYAHGRLVTTPAMYCTFDLMLRCTSSKHISIDAVVFQCSLLLVVLHQLVN